MPRLRHPSIRHAFSAAIMVCFAPSAKAGAPAPATDALTPPRPAPAWQSTLSASSGYTTGSFDWSIPNGNTSPNILSELTWEDLDIWCNTLRFEAVRHQSWTVLLDVSHGSILDGRNQDSDYALSNRRGEFSRSYAEVDGETLAARAMLGYRIPLWNGRAAATPSLGYAFDFRKFEDTQGYQAIDTLTGWTGPFPGLDSSYETEWHAGVFDLGISLQLTEDFELLAGGSFSMGSYDAKAVWNLRDDFAQDPSFRHAADAFGASARLGVRYRLTQSWFIHGLAVYQTQWTDDGRETILFTDGRESNGFNGATWESIGFALGLDYRF